MSKYAADGWPHDEAFGRELARREIRRAIAGHLRLLQNDHRAGCPCTPCAAVRAIDRATRAPRKARTK